MSRDELIFLGTCMLLSRCDEFRVIDASQFAVASDIALRLYDYQHPQNVQPESH